MSFGAGIVLLAYVELLEHKATFGDAGDVSR